MNIKSILVFVIAAFFLASVGCASAEIYAKEYSVDYNILYNKAIVYNSITLSDNTSVSITFIIPKDAEAISLYVDGLSKEAEFNDGKLKVELNGNSQIRFNYITRYFLDKNTFVSDFSAPFDIDSLKLNLILPPKATVKNVDNAVIPKPTSYRSDGQSIIINWERQLNKGEDIPVVARFSPEPNYFLIISIIILVMLIAIIFFALKKQKIQKEVETKIIKEIVHEGIEEHLKEDEEQIVNVLKQREGSCEQGTLGIITGFPKATLSRILKELEDRKIIIKQKKGKKNLIFLRK